MKKPPCVRAIYLIALFFYCSLAGAQYTAPSKPFTIKENEPRTGSNLTGRIAEGDLPFDKPYSEFTQEQKNKVKEQYQSMAEDDEPPFPIDGLASLYKPISQAQRTLLLEGVLDMEVEVDAKGKARSVSVRKSPSAELTQVAAAALMFQVYKPAVCGGKPCAMVFPLRLNLIRR